MTPISRRGFVALGAGAVAAAAIPPAAGSAEAATGAVTAEAAPGPSAMSSTWWS